MATRVCDEADFVIVGTGAGGATAARVLSAAGHSVLMLEEGPDLRGTSRALRLADAMQESIRDFATLTTQGGAPMPLLQGRCVGGSTAVNSGIIWRLPDRVRAEWVRERGLDLLLDELALDAHFGRIEQELGIADTPSETRGGNGALMERASKALGLPGRAIRRNAPNCKGSARCLQGCPNQARMSMDVSYVPRALQSGGRLHALWRADRITFASGRAVAVTGQILDPQTRAPVQPFEARARRGVIVAAGAVHTPLLLRASGVTRLVGDGFMAHPGAAVVGRFDDPVGMGFGATQSYQVPLPDQDMKLESLSLPPELLAARLPGVGESWQRRLHNLDYYAQWCVVVRMRARGSVRRALFGGPRVLYAPEPRDLQRLKEGVALLIRMMFAAGAREVYPGVARLPELITDPTDADWVLAPTVRRSDFHLMASHHFGTAAAGHDPRHSVVDPMLQCHDVPGLYVMDASALPTNIGVNPQHSIMALVFRASELLANQERPRLAA
jgi:choline dehydrogenase-like flavoprotein